MGTDYESIKILRRHFSSGTFLSSLCPILKVNEYLIIEV